MRTLNGMDKLLTEINDIFHPLNVDVFYPKRYDVRNYPTNQTAPVSPYSLQKDDSGITITADIPGCSREGVSIIVNDKRLEISATREGEKNPSFVRHFELLPTTDASSILATVKNGVLKITIPTAKPPEPTRIEIKVN